MRVLLDTSVLIGADAPADVDAAICVVSITELHFGALVATDPDERAARPIGWPWSSRPSIRFR